MGTEVSHHPDRHRFEIAVDGQVVGFLEYRRVGSSVDLAHTVVYPEFEGRGLGNALVGAVLDHARSENWAIIPSCPFVALYLNRHPEYADLAP